jgi:hypothetical protein
VSDIVTTGAVLKRRIEPSPHARADFVRTPFVRERFELRPSSVQRLRSTPWSFGFGAFSEIVYRDNNYCRLKADGTLEEWPDTIQRVVNGVMSIRKDHYLRNRLVWDEGRWQETAEEMALAFLRLECGPPGRGYSMMGTDFVYQRGSFALTNCAATSLKKETIDKDFGWAADALLCGSGVGFECIPDTGLRGVLSAPSGTPCTFSVPDSREGWVESIELLIGSYMGKHGAVEFAYDEIRPEGTPIKSFGGVCPGPEPLRKLHARMRQQLDKFVRGEITATRLKADIANQIGDCVVSGGVRRSAEILIGDPEDTEFLDLKDYSKNPDRKEWGHLSNNSPRLTKREHFLLIPTHIAPRAIQNGEPGLLNFIAIQRFARFGREKPDPATLIQPCQPAWATLLTPHGVRTMGEISVGDAIWSGKRWTKVVRKVPTGVKPVLAYRTRAGTFYGTENHRVVQDGEKVEVKDAQNIDVSFCREILEGEIQVQDVMDGIVFGDGSKHKASNDLVYLCVGKDDEDYFKSEISSLFVEDRSVSFCASKSGAAWVVQTTIGAEEVPKTFERKIPDRFARGSPGKVRGFLRGLFTANGSVVGKGSSTRVTLKAASFAVIEETQALLSSIGIRSYYSVNEAHDVEFENGTYTCRKSYDLNICTADDKKRFLSLVGFLQGYKVERLVQSFGPIRPRPAKTSYGIVSVELLGEEPVFDITVEDDEHTYWTGGMLVSNCGELPLVPKEICTLSENYPSRAPDHKAIIRNAELTCCYTSTVALLPTHRPETNKVVAQNRRIGVGMSGIADWQAKESLAQITRTLRQSYLAVGAENERLAAEAGVPASIRVTTVKPSGTVSLLAGVSPGGHFAMGEFYIRRKRVSTLSPYKALLDAAGYPFEKAEGDNTLAYEFPQAQPHVRTQKQAGMFEQALVLCMLQREWSDNAVSFSISFNPKSEGPLVGNLLAHIAPMVKSVSVMPLENDYELAPYEEISEREYLLRRKMEKPIDWSSYRGVGSDEADKFCNNATGTCEVRK